MSEKSKVALIGCPDYDQAHVNEAVNRGLTLLGGIDKFVKPEEKILLKPNFLRGKPPETAVATHPAVFSAVVDALHDAGMEKLYYGDSPGSGAPARAAEVTGFKAVGDEKNVALLEFNAGQPMRFPEGQVCKMFEMAQAVIESDAVISLSKMKTHGLTRLTGAVKNQLGCVYGMNKAACHAKYPDIFDFSRMLVDLNMFVKPRLYIMDGIVAMEGNGPGNGDPVPMRVLLMSEDPVALDSVYAKLVDIDRTFIPTNVVGEEMGLGVSDPDKIEIVGDDWHDFVNKDFNVERIPAKGEAARLGMLQYVRNLITRKPVVDKDKCVGCGICEHHCPQNPKAIVMEEVNGEKKARYKYNHCIRCYCCQEMCPKEAISIKTPLFGKLFLYR